MIKEIASFYAMGQQKSRLIELEGVLRLEIFRQGEWCCEWQSAATGLLNRKSGLRKMNEYIIGYQDSFAGLDLVS